MKRFIEEVSRAQVSLLPKYLDDFVAAAGRATRAESIG